MGPTLLKIDTSPLILAFSLREKGETFAAAGAVLPLSGQRQNLWK
jgi:hypothetical protein